jgi:hypothetical protein
MKKRYLFFFLISSLVLINACQKEYSFEGGSGPSEGTLQDDGTGDCLPKTVSGTYVAGTVLDGTVSYIEVQANVTTIGSYTITTDTVNGIYFRGTGVFTTTGLNTVRLKGNGTPAAAGISNFIVSYGTSGCTISVTVAGSLAAFTLGGAPGTCTAAVPAGTYTVGVPLTSANTVDINVIVTAIGAYNVSTTLSNGIIFTGSGVFTTTGSQTIVLSAAGTTPAAAGSTNIPVVAGSSSCAFTVNVTNPVAPANYTVNCGTPTINGTYTQNTALTASNTVGIKVDVVTPGTYTITATGGGMSFTASGTFAAAGTGLPVTLTGVTTSTPNTSGAVSVAVTGGTASCNFTVNVVAAAGAATFTVNCGTAVPNGTYTAGVALTAANTISIGVTVTTPGTYTITTTPVNGITFTASGTFATTGTPTVNLVGSGTPGAGTWTITVPGPPSCTFPLTIVPTSADYFPRTTNSNWSYEFDDDATDSLLRKVIATPFTALGNTYSIFMHNDGTGFDSSGYYRKNGGDYFEYLDIGGFIGFDNALRSEYVMLKDNVAQGTSWQSAGFSGTVTAIPLTLRFNYKILQKDVDVTVVTSTGSVIYHNVIVVEEKYDGFTGGNWVDITSQIDFYGKSYYAKGVGLIKYEALDAANAVQYLQEMRRSAVF